MKFADIKQIYGHDCGDFVLISVTEVMQSCIREQDILARWGGEKFLFLLPDTNSDGGKIIVEKIRKGIDCHRYKYNNLSLSVTMTFGVCCFCEPGMDIQTCINSADTALYRGKESGKNCVILA